MSFHFQSNSKLKGLKVINGGQFSDLGFYDRIACASVLGAFKTGERERPKIRSLSTGPFAVAKCRVSVGARL